MITPYGDYLSLEVFGSSAIGNLPLRYRQLKLASEKGPSSQYCSKMTSFFFLSDNNRYWIGGHQRFDDQGWCWGAQHTPITLFDWYPGEPNDDKGDDERCMEVRESSFGMRWNDESCSSNLCYICEMAADTETILD